MEDASATHSQRRCLICRRSKRHNGATVKNKIMSPNWENITSVSPLELHALNDALPDILMNVTSFDHVS